MSLPNYLAKIKSSGIYRFVWDKSEIAGVDAEILRLVVGYSDKGPFNTPVYVKSEAEFKSIFGDISKKLEKRGAYFHRMALQCLAKGPILALNLKKFADKKAQDAEKVQGAAFDVIGKNITPIEIPVESVYDTTRFWKLSPEDAHKALCEKPDTDKSNYISFVATDSKDASCSIIMRGYHPTGYDVTVANWYDAQGEDVPEYFKGYTDMLVSDFFAEVYVFKGKFTAALCAAEPLNRYFDIDKDGNPVLKEYVVNAFGEKVDTLPLLAAESASNLVNSYSGCLLPFFKGNNGAYISLDLLFNADNHLHKMMMNLDSDLLYNGTLAPTDIATTGWNNNDTIILGTTVKKTEIKYGVENTKPVLDASRNIVVGFENQLTVAESPVGAEPTCFEPNFVSYTTTPKNIDVKNIAGYLYFVVETDIEGEASKTYSRLVAVDDGAAYEELYLANDGKLFAKIGDVEIPLNVVADTAAYKFTKSGTSESFYGYYCDTDRSQAMIYKKGKCTGNSVSVNSNPEELHADVNLKFDFSTIGLKVGDRVLYGTNDAKIYTIAEIYTDHLVAYDSRGKSGKSVEIKSDFKLCNSSCGINNNGLYPVYFEGYTLAPELAKPGLDMLSKLNWQKEILSAIVEYSGLRLALTNRTDIDYRYIVDTFEAFVDTEVHKELALICKEKDNALGFLNFPAAKTFRDCPYTSFTDQNNRFQVKYIAEGGNRQKNPGRLFTLVSEDNGASFVSYNTPLTFTDGTVKTYVPSAAMVSNNFMEKYLSRQPYYIVAGPTYGRMIANGLVGPDFNYSRADLDILEPMGVNAMVYVPRLGTYINSNQTAKQNPKTALSSINVRELVIYLQDEIEKLLQDYQWEFNTPGLRELIKAKADVICERVKNNGGIYDFLNVCDKSNNTDDVIDNEMFVLSTSIEPGRGAGKMVQELTLYKTGGMQSIIR